MQHENGSASATNHYLYNGKELNTDLGLDWYDYGARFYDGALGRFTTIDRFAEKYFSNSSFGYAANNPIKFIDVNGDSIDVYSPEGSLLYVFDDGKKEITGLYFQNSSSCDDGSCTYSDGVSFNYNDIKEDRTKAHRGDFSFNVIGDKEINDIVAKGVAEAGTTLGDHYLAGRASGSLDFYAKTDSPIEANTLNIITGAKSGTVAYNPHDYGNYLTGQAFRQLGGYGVGDIRLGAHINNIFNGRKDYSRGDAGFFDSRADQRAISNGYYHFSTKDNLPKSYNYYGGFPTPVFFDN